MEKYLLHGKLSAKKGQGEQFADLLLQAANGMQNVKGCISYVISKDPDAPDDVWITELWESKDDHDNSLKLESVRAIIMQAMPLIEGQPQKGQELMILGGKGV